MNIDDLMNEFRLGSRELFNRHFRVPRPYVNDLKWGLQDRYFRMDNPHPKEEEEAWRKEDRFEKVESVLFETLVLEPAGLPITPYGCANQSIRVQLRFSDAPIMISRTSDSGPWDHPVRIVTQNATMDFVCFFDWDSLGYRDHRYVRVEVTDDQSQPPLCRQHGLIETQYVRFSISPPGEAAKRQIGSVIP